MASFPTLTFHGGLCCGIKHIHGFRSRPGDIIPERKAGKGFEIWPDQYSRDVETKKPFFFGERPAETMVERLDAILEYCKDHRPAGLIEAALTHELDFFYDGGGSNTQDEVWGPELKKRGFEAVTTFKNSNSGNEVTVYHLVYDEDEE